MRSFAPPACRSTVAGVLAAGLVAVAAAGVVAQETETLAPSADLSTQSLVVSTWAGYLPEDLPAAFESEFGAPVTLTHHTDDEEIMARLTAGGDPGIDVAFVSGASAQALAEAGLLEPIHHDLVPDLANLYPEANQLAYDPGNVWSVPYSWGTTGLCYREDLLATPPDSWYDLLTPAEDATGRTTMMATERWLMLPAQKALGFSANTAHPAEMEQVKELLAATKPTLMGYDDSTFHDRLVSGDAALVEAWDSWCNYAIADETVGSEIGFVVPVEGSALWADAMVIPRTSMNKEAAHAFIDSILRPDVHVWVVENLLYKVPNRAAMELVDPALVQAFPNLGMAPAELLSQESLLDLGAAAPLYHGIAAEIAAQ